MKLSIIVEAPTSPPTTISVTFLPGQTLAQAIYLSGKFLPPALCSGLGTCGQCTVQFISTAPQPTPKEQQVLAHNMLDDGFRLSCQHIAKATMHVRLQPKNQALSSRLSLLAAAPNAHTSAMPALPHNNLPHPHARQADTCCTHALLPAVLAIDLGTTSIHYGLGTNAVQEKEQADSNGTKATTAPPCHNDATQMPTYKWLDSSEINPQMGAGSELISRLAYAQKDESNTLQALILQRIRHLIATQSYNVKHICLAANPAMTLLALGKEISSLARAPYSLPYKGGTWEHVENLPPMWVPPLVAPFVGGDITAGYAYLTHTIKPKEYPYLLADLGTNGEFLLALSPTQAVVTSVALGPALEGIGLRFGTAIAPGAITSVTVTPAGLQANIYSAPSSPAPACIAGITGTGYLSIIHSLLTAQAITPSGEFSLHASPLIAKAIQKIQSAPCHCPLCKGNAPAPKPQSTAYIPLPHNLYISAADIEEVLKVKASFSLGITLLLQHANIATKDIRQVFLAGAMGSHVNIASLEGLGFFPHGMNKRITAIGNSSLEGAKILVANQPEREKLIAWAPYVQALDLSNTPEFMNNYIKHMQFAWI